MNQEKVIKALEALEKAMCDNECYACSYEFVDAVDEFGTNIIADAIDMLKKQLPAKVETEDGGTSWWHVCGECRGVVDDSDKFCKHCGRPLIH